MRRSFLNRREGIKHMVTSVASLFGLGFAFHIGSQRHLAHNTGPGRCSRCGCQGFEGSSYICSNYYCHHTWNDHQ